MNLQVGDCTSLTRPYEELIAGSKAPYPPKGPYEFGFGLEGLGFRDFG